MEDLVKIYEYELNEEILEKAIEERRKLTNDDVNIQLHELLEEESIKYRNKLDESWDSSDSIMPKHIIVIEVYVNKYDVEKAQKIIASMIEEDKGEEECQQ